jgi:hypothetical protein
MRLLALLALLCSPLIATAQSLVIYNETLGNLPTPQGWVGFLNLGTATETYVSNIGARVNTTSENNTVAGYINVDPFSGAQINPLFPVLNRQAGVSLRFDLSVTVENHFSNDRAGFSVLMVTDDLFGIELGFWSNEIWAQNVGFTHGEGAPRDTTLTTSYLLNVQGNDYELLANNSTLLSGDLRDYSSFGAPYSYQNTIFLGDDTTSANADFTLGRVTITAAVPEPATWVMISLTGAAAFYIYRRKYTIIRK